MRGLPNILEDVVEHETEAIRPGEMAAMDDHKKGPDFHFSVLFSSCSCSSFSLASGRRSVV